MAKVQSNFELLRTKSILAILDGDIDFGEIEVNSGRGNIKISLPYLSGSVLCEISTQFGLPVTYSWSGGAKSRWEYLNDLLAYCIDNHRESDLLSFLFSKGQFAEKLRGYDSEIIDSAHQMIVATVIKQINGALYFGGHELVKFGEHFQIIKNGETISVVVPSVKTIDRSYIISLSERAMKDVLEGNFDSAITKSRTLLEEVFCYTIEKKNEVPSESGDRSSFYRYYRCSSP